MNVVIGILIGLIAFLHLYILWFEMFAWESKGPKIFNTFSKTLFAPTKPMAANQGLYNGFLAAGLIWTYFIENIEWRMYVSLFFLVCVVVAGIFGALTITKKIFFIQALPAILAIILILMAHM